MYYAEKYKDQFKNDIKELLEAVMIKTKKGNTIVSYGSYSFEKEIRETGTIIAR